MRLLGVELTRFRWRRAIALMVLGGVVTTAFLAASTLWETRPVSAEDRAAAVAQARAEARSPGFQREMRRCEDRPQEYFGPGATAADCAEMRPRPEWFLQRSELSLAEERHDSGAAVVLLLAALMVVAGTTFAGADWASGSMSNQLLFEPRRARVWAAKAAAVFLGAAMVSAVVIAAFWTTLYLGAEARGLDVGATVQEQVREAAGRGVLLAAGGALVAYGLTMLLRHTVGALAVLFAYVVGGEILLLSLPWDGMARWSLVTNVFAWLQGRYEYFDPTLPCEEGFACDQMAVLSAGGAATFLGALLLMVLVLSVASFRRRDVP